MREALFDEAVVKGNLKGAIKNSKSQMKENTLND